MPATDSFYETDKAISEYLLFHYGKAEHFNGPSESFDFSKRCAELAFRHPLKFGRALDLGCAVGRSACELSAYFEKTIGIDFSHGLIEAAERMKSGVSAEAEIATEGNLTKTIELQRPSSTRPDCLTFRQGDAMELPKDIGTFDYVLMANLIDRLPDPARCLRSIGAAVNPGGILAITSPYTWLEEYTPIENWLGGYISDGEEIRTHQALQHLLAADFEEIESLDMPFLIREHERKNQYSVAHATLWRRR